MLIGGTAPVTIAGALTQANAEQLTGLLICQLIREGAPVVCGGGILFMDMTYGLISYAAPEFMLAMAALSELCHYYSLPIFSFAGCSDSKEFDQQAAAEGALWILITALSGGNLIHDVGYIESGLTASYDMIVAMDEVAAMVKRFMRGVEIDRESLALEVIDAIGPGGDFVAAEHTYRNFRRNWVPRLMDRASRGDWEAAGSLSMGDRTAARVRDILENHLPEGLPDALNQELDSIIEQAEKRAAG
jgi:trimethylamine--corrinoid protein Co-methyltransferase